MGVVHVCTPCTRCACPCRAGISPSYSDAFDAHSPCTRCACPCRAGISPSSSSCVLVGGRKCMRLIACHTSRTWRAGCRLCVIRGRGLACGPVWPGPASCAAASPWAVSRASACSRGSAWPAAWPWGTLRLAPSVARVALLRIPRPRPASDDGPATRAESL
jgi:hypothetical protein